MTAVTIDPARVLCGCGCGQPAPLAQKNNARLGHVKGQPLARITGHNKRGTSDLTRHVQADHGYRTPCWDWTGSVGRKGYGAVQVDGIKKNAHRAVYEATHGILPRSIHLDHLCRNKLCVNPEHMEPVTPLENETRKRAALVIRMVELTDA